MAVTGALLMGTTVTVGGVATAVTFTMFAGGIVGNLLITTAVSAILGALSPKPSAPAGSGYQTNTGGSALDHQIIYGKARVGGVILFDETTGSNNKFLHRVVGIAGHEVASFEDVYINDELATIDSGTGNVSLVTDQKGNTSDRYDGKMRINLHLGSSTQPADSDLVAEVGRWSEQHTLSGIAYIYVRMEYNQDTFPNGIPTFTTTVKGKKVKNPATGSTVWSDNPALCLRDYLTSKGYGLGEEEANVDDDLVNAAVVVCDDTNTNAGTKRYTTNGVFTTGATPYDMLSALLTSMSGTMWYAQGKWRMRPAYWTAPVMDLDEDDLRSSISVATRHSRRDNFNVIKGTFRGEESNWQVTDYPQVTNPAFLDADGGQESVADVNMPFTDTSVTARRLARIALERNRQQLTISASFGLRTLGLQVGDNVRITNNRFGWANKEFQVISWNFGLTDGLDLQTNMVLQETSERVFDEVSDGIIYERDNTNLPSPFYVESVGISIEVEQEAVNEKVTNIAVISITATEDAFIDKVEVEFKLASKTKWRKVGSGPVGDYEVLGIVKGFYDFRARAVNTFGVKGEWTTAPNVEIDPNFGPPDNVTNFDYELSGGSLFLSWDAVENQDLSHYIIKHNSSSTLGVATWSNSSTIIRKVARPSTTATVTARSGTYLIAAVDKERIESEIPTSFLIDPSEIPSLGVSLLLTEDPAFTGDKTNVLLASGFFVSPAIEIDDTSSANPTGTYNFSSYVETAQGVKSCRITGFKTFERKYDGFPLLWDAIPENFDSWPDTFDSWTNEDANFGDVNVVIYVAATEDDPTGSPVWGQWTLANGSYLVGSAFKFKAVLTSTNTNYTPTVVNLSVTVEF